MIYTCAKIFHSTNNKWHGLEQKWRKIAMSKRQQLEMQEGWGMTMKELEVETRWKFSRKVEENE